MRKALASMLALAFLALGLVGIAWSGQSPVQAEPQAPPAAPEGDPEGNLLELYPEPVEATGACCVADCSSEREDCWVVCSSAPNIPACREQCSIEYQECRSHC